MYLIAGLGNPEKKYDNTRHNVGFDVIDVLAARYSIPVVTRKCRALVGMGLIDGNKVMLAKPQTYMNLSGESIRALMEYYEIPVENLIVFCDDVNLDVGVMRIRKGGSAGGHNGLKNIILQLATDGFKRIRVGVGKKPEEMDLVKFVLSHFGAKEREVLEKTYRDAADAAVTVMNDGPDAAMNLFNGKRNE